MQIDRILEKASRLGISIDTNLSNEENLSLIASSLGVDSGNLNAIENKLDDRIALGGSGNSFSGGNQNSTSLEKDAKKEVKSDTKFSPDVSSNSAGKNKFEKAKDNLNMLNSKKNQISTKIYGATHPQELVKNELKKATDNIKKNTKEKIKKKLKKEKKEIAKKGIVELIKKNPYVLAVIVILCILIIIMMIIAGSSSGNSGEDDCTIYDANNLSLKRTEFSRDKFVSIFSDYFSQDGIGWVNCTALFKYYGLEAFAGEIYDVSVSEGFNPEIAIARAIAEGCSPSANNDSTSADNRYDGVAVPDWKKAYNIWGIRCYSGSIRECMAFESLEAGIKKFGTLVTPYDNAVDMMAHYISEDAAESNAEKMAIIRNKIFYYGNKEKVCNSSSSGSYGYGEYTFKYDANGSVNVDNPPNYIAQFNTKNFDIKEITNGDISGCSCQSASLAMIILAIGDVNYLVSDKDIPIATSTSCPEINKYHATIHYYMVGLGIQYSGWHYGASGNKCGGIQRITAIPEDDRQGLGIKIGPIYSTGNAETMLKYLRNGWLIQYHITSAGCPLGQNNCEGMGQTSGGHYGLIYGYDSDKNNFLVHDNGNVSRQASTVSYDAVNNYLTDFIPVSVYGKEDIS